MQLILPLRLINPILPDGLIDFFFFFAVPLRCILWLIGLDWITCFREVTPKPDPAVEQRGRVHTYATNLYKGHTSGVCHAASFRVHWLSMEVVLLAKLVGKICLHLVIFTINPHWPDFNTCVSFCL